jgi:hypothetical protein
MGIVASTASYEAWLAEQLPLVAEDLERKHELMAEGPFPFFRGTYYRWLETVLEVAPELDGPSVASVGDLHTENFGTWRDREGRRVWGVNDFDESERLPWALDLARLATSALLAGLALKPADVCDALLRGYARGLEDGGAPYVLDGHHAALARFVAKASDSPAKWWTDALEPFRKSAAVPVPDEARAALAEVVPTPGWRWEARPRLAGVGSRGPRRLLLVGELAGAPAARELKELGPPAGRWLGRRASKPVDTAAIVRAPDPLNGRAGGWQARRLAPDCIKLDVAKLSRSRELKVLAAMGAETANVHLGDRRAVAGIRRDLTGRGDDWLVDAASRLAKAARKDARAWRKSRA